MYPSCPHSSHATAVNAAVDAEVDCLLLFLLRKEGEYVGDWYLHTEKIHRPTFVDQKRGTV